MKKILKFVCILLCACICLSAFTACSKEGKQPVIPTPTPTPEPTSTFTPETTFTPTPETTSTPTPEPTPTPTPKNFAESYSKLTSIVADDTVASGLLQLLDSSIEDNATLDVAAYTEKIVTAMVTYDLQNATATAIQCKTDNFALAGIENFEINSIEETVVATMASQGEVVNALKEDISAVLQDVAQTKSDPVSRIYTLSEMEAKMQHYAGYDRFLQQVIQNGDASFSAAAEKVRAGMQAVGQLTVAEGAPFFFSKKSFTALKQQEKYTSDSDFQTFVDLASEAISSLEIPNTGTDTSEVAWKKAYLNYMIEQDLTYLGRSILLNINGTAIPELYYSSGFTAGGDILCCYTNDTLITQYMDVYGLKYIEGQNLFLDSGGHMDYYYDIVYRIENGAFVKYHTGEYGRLDNLDPAWDDVNQNGIWDDNEPEIYDYYWDGKKLSSESAYREALNAVYDEQKETALDHDTFRTFGEIAKEIILY